MTNRERLIAALASAPLSVAEEIGYRVQDVEHEEAYDAADALVDLSDLADASDEWKEYRAPCRRLLIAAGYYQPMSERDINSTFVTRGKPWEFKMGGVAYRAAEAMSLWLER
jgi:hypothetical protein